MGILFFVVWLMTSFGIICLGFFVLYGSFRGECVLERKVCEQIFGFSFFLFLAP